MTFTQCFQHFFVTTYYIQTMLHFISDILILLLSVDCSLLFLHSYWVANSAVSPANVAVITPSHFGISPMYNKYRVTPRTFPCGTSVEIFFKSE